MIKIFIIFQMYQVHFSPFYLQDQLSLRDGDNVIMQKSFEIYLSFIQTTQSETVQKHSFAALRSFINRVSFENCHN